MISMRRLLIANRGEIACRIIRTARAMGIHTVAVYSDADEKALHVKMADTARHIGPNAASESYLAIPRVIAAARESGCDAIHPGYGFLSENAEFASACRDAGILFIGPSPEAIDIMGDKARAKRAMIDAGVPCIPGYQGEDQSAETMIVEAHRIGCPLMIKAAAGGGGRGMRLVENMNVLASSLQAARSEAMNAFACDDLILEKALVRARHVEVQVFGDRHQNIVHLGERDCSVQRRHQKVIEEAPCPVMTPQLRERMGQAAVSAARAVDYVGAGTVEFLLDEDFNFYFLEMNTRLQVEHPVTECVTGIDLVELQLRVARGEPLGFAQEDVRFSGHAIEVRLYAEDPQNDFLPSVGKVVRWREPRGTGVRVDAGIEEGSGVSSYYDPMLAKIIAQGRAPRQSAKGQAPVDRGQAPAQAQGQAPAAEDLGKGQAPRRSAKGQAPVGMGQAPLGSGQAREEARLRLVSALADSALVGVATNRDFLIDALTRETFKKGQALTGFIEQTYGDAGFRLAPGLEELAMAAVVHYKCRGRRALRASVGVHTELLDWSSGVRLESVFTYALGDGRVTLTVRAMAFNRYRVSDGDTFSAEYEVLAFDAETLSLASDGEKRSLVYFEYGDGLTIATPKLEFEVQDLSAEFASDDNAAKGAIISPMHGQLLEVYVEPGDAVSKGQRLALLEAMKMQQEIRAEADGQVKAVHAEPGAQIAMGAVLIEMQTR